MSRFFDLANKRAEEAESRTPTDEQRSTQDRPIIRLDSNENPLGPSPRALEAMQRVLAEAHLYPDDDCAALTRKLSELHEIPVEQVLVTAGSEAMLSLLCHALLAPGMNAITSQRSFIVYEMVVRASRAELIKIPMQNNAFDLSAILKAIDKNTRLIFLANPNNPTGTIVSMDELERFIRAVPGHVVVVLDEAYYEFAACFAERRKVQYSHSLTYVREGASVVVLRTFSKAHGLAGVRIGYGLGAAELISHCARMQDTYSVSSLAQAAAIAALYDRDHVARSVSHNAEQAQYLEHNLSALGWRAVPTWANFVYCEIGKDADAVSRLLYEQGISVRALGPWGAPKSIRVSVGTAQQNEHLLEALRKISATTSSQPKSY